jgi:hypothetical protein
VATNKNAPLQFAPTKELFDLISLRGKEPESRNRMTIPFQGFHNNNMSLDWCGFCHLRKNCTIPLQFGPTKELFDLISLPDKEPKSRNMMTIPSSRVT